MVLVCTNARESGQGRRRRTSLTIGLAATLFPAPLLAQGAPAPATSAVPSAAPASVILNPKRITFDRTGKSAVVNVASAGGAGAFDIELADRVMLPDGQIVAATAPEAAAQLPLLKSAKDYMLVTPRRIRVAANVGQVIRLRASATANLAPGEYRTHLTVTGIPPADTGLTAEQAAGQKEGQLSFRINSVLSVAIPVILRVGPIDVRAAFEKTSLGYEVISPDGRAAPARTAVLSLDLVRVGANSLFGDIEVRGSKKGEEPIGIVRGIGVYPEIGRRTVRILLARAPAPGERLEIQFRDNDTSPGAILSKASLAAP